LSYYNSVFDLEFKKSFSASYVNFSDAEISNMASEILLRLTRITSSSDKKLIEILEFKKIHKNIIDRAFKIDKNYEETYKNYAKSSKLLDLFRLSSEIMRVSDSDSKKRLIYSRLRKDKYDKEAIRYAKKENIPLEFSLLSLIPDCTKTLTGFFLKKYLKISFNTEILDTCKRNSARWHNNLELLTPYERTSEFQRYLYSLCNRYKGSELEIPSKLMRIILSTARLHFTFMDEANLSPNDLILLLEKQKEAAKNEEAIGYSHFHNGNSVSKKLDRKYIYKWRQRHLMPFLLESDDLAYLSRISDADPMFDVRLVLIGSRLVKAVDLHSLDFSKTPQSNGT
jgi:hypothetical protein